MKRRDFLKTGVGAGIAAGSAYFFGNCVAANAKNQIISNIDKYDLAAIRGGEPEVMFDKVTNPCIEIMVVVDSATKLRYEAGVVVP